jgi:SAM-dependent methyltransferase
MAGDTEFAGSIPQVYDECLVPVLFEPYAEDLVERASDLPNDHVLEIAAGTGAVTLKLAPALPQQARIVATDLNPDMIAIARAKSPPGRIAWLVADAHELAFHDDSFDLVLCQFGAMFFANKVKAYREVRRVLHDEGAFVFNVWDRLEANNGSEAVHEAVRAVVPDPKPDFLRRVPFGYYDEATIRGDLAAAGFARVRIDHVTFASPPEQAASLARGLCQGAPLAGELARHPPEVRERALQAAIAAVRDVAASEPLNMSALVVTALA